jgi:triacylglycerol lipase
MGAGRFVGRVGALAVALGVGAAIAGWGSGIALAQDGETPAGGQSPATSESTDKPEAKDPPKDPGEAAGGAEDANAEADEGGTEAKPDKPRSTKRGDRPRRAAAQQRPVTVERPESEPAEPAEPADPGPAEEPDPTPVDALPESAPRIDVPVPEAPPVEPDIAGTVETATSAKASAAAVFKPAAAPSTDLPVAAPQLWSLLAFTRREFEAKPSPGATPAATQTTGEPRISGPQAAAAAAPAAAPGSITYTAPPTLIDRITVVALRVMQVVGKVLGIDIYGNIGKLMASASPPFFAKFGLDVQRTEFEVAPGNVWKVWEFAPPEPSGKTVVAVHGGGFILEPIALHWIDYADMARRTGATVVVPIYPLATTEKGAAVNVIPGLADYISAQIALRGAENVSIYADSAGPVAALGAVRELILRGEPVPASMVLISFAPDASLSNPDIATIKDPIIDPQNLDFYVTVNHWGDGLEPTDPMLSALFVESEVFQQLPPTTIYVGDLEFIYPDNLLYYQRALDEGVPISLVVGRGQIHDWPVGALPINSQALKVRKNIFRQLGVIA